jgi:hypothetical protein
METNAKHPQNRFMLVIKLGKWRSMFMAAKVIGWRYRGV